MVGHGVLTGRVVRCRTDEGTARERVLQRAELRSAHPDAYVLDDPAYYDAYSWLELDVPFDRCGHDRWLQANDQRTQFLGRRRIAC